MMLYRRGQVAEVATPQVPIQLLPAKPDSNSKTMLVATGRNGVARVVTSPQEVNYDEVVEQIPVAEKG
jgi:hypothetical protein